MCYLGATQVTRYSSNRDDLHLCVCVLRAIPEAHWRLGELNELSQRALERGLYCVCRNWVKNLDVQVLPTVTLLSRLESEATTLSCRSG